jgi:hypothetical protein
LITDIPIPLFPRRTKLGNTKVLSFKTSEYVSFKVRYASDEGFPQDISTSILDAKVTGVAEKIEKLKGVHDCHDPTVKVSLKLTDAGLVEVLHSEVICEIREKKNLADKFKGLFGGGKEKEEKDEQVSFHLHSIDFRLCSNCLNLNLRPLSMPKQLPVRWIRLKRFDMRKPRYEFLSSITLQHI